MYPTLATLGPFPIHTYGLLIAIGFLLCVAWGKKEADRIGIDGEKIIDLGFWSLLVGMLGSRILYVFTRLDHFAQNPLEVFYVWEGGLVFFGGPLGCLPFFFWYTKRNKLPRAKVLDLAAQCVPLAHAFGRLGCFFAGCCHGKPTDLPWSVKLYSDLVDPGLRGVAIHPSQIYESIALFGLFLFLVFRRTRKRFDGELAFLYLILYSVIRIFTETFRGDRVRGFVIDQEWLSLSTSQFIGILVIVGAGFGIWRTWQKTKRST